MDIYNQYVQRIQGDLSNYGPSPEWIWRNLCEMALQQTLKGKAKGWVGLVEFNPDTKIVIDLVKLADDNCQSRGLWDQTARFKALVLKRADGLATGSENAEFDELQAARRKHDSKDATSGD